MEGKYVKLEANPSGCTWLVEDEDWKALEADGWIVDWAETRIPSIPSSTDPAAIAEGSLAQFARLHDVALKDAIQRFERITKMGRDFFTASDHPLPFLFSVHDAQGKYLMGEPSEIIVPMHGPIFPRTPEDDL